MVNSRMDPKIKALSTVGLFAGCNKKSCKVWHDCARRSPWRRGSCSPPRALRAESVL
jgi:hypothetical protein